MPFIGKNPNAGFATIVKDTLTADGSTTQFTLSKQVASATDVAVFVGNVRQEPTAAYTVSGTTLDFGSGNAPAVGLDMYVLHIGGTQETSIVPADDTISTAKIQSSAVTDAKIASGITATKVYPNGVRAADLDVATQGVGLSGWEHIETRVAKSDGDANFENGNGNAAQDTGASTVAINLSTLKTRYSCYKIYFQLVHTGPNTQNLLFDTMKHNQTSTNQATWYGSATIQDNSNGHAAGLQRAGSTTMKLINNMWARGSTTTSYRGGAVGEMTLYGFHPEVTANMDGFDHNTHSEDTSHSEIAGTGYRPYMKWNCHSYNQGTSLYQGLYGTARQNQTFRVNQTGSANDSFGGFMFLSNTTISGDNYKFAKGSYFSIYGLRMPTGD